MKTALFLPNYLGGGFGHISRCLALAEAFRARSGAAFFAMSGPHAHVVHEAGFRVCPLSTPPATAASGKGGPAYVYIPDMSYQIVRDGFDNPGRVDAALNEIGRISDEVRPDALVGDGYPLTFLAGRISGIPVVQFVKSAGHPRGRPMVWWEETPPGLVPPDVRPVFAPVFARLGLPPLNGRAEELLRGDLLLLPSIPPLAPWTPCPRTRTTWDRSSARPGAHRRPRKSPCSPAMRRSST
jgi:hypothetical protein